MQFFDTHAHIGLIYDDPIEQLRVVQQAKQAGVTRIVSINNSLHDFKKVYANLKSFSGIYHAVGVAPSEKQDWTILNSLVTSAARLNFLSPSSKSLRNTIFL